MRTRPLLLAGCAALACTTTRPTATTTGTTTPTTNAAATAASTSTSTLAPGLAAAEVRRRLGEPRKVERVTSSTSQGTVYERWRYPEREVVLLDGKVIDVVP
jgi:hypothetical protein